MTRDSRSTLILERIEEGYCGACARRSCTKCTRRGCTCTHTKRRTFPTDVLHAWVQAHGRIPKRVLTQAQRVAYNRKQIGAGPADEIAYAFGAHPSEIWDDWWQQ